MNEHNETAVRNEPLPAAKVRPLAVIEAELDMLKQDTRQKETALLCNYIEVGRRLEEAKAQLVHGQWGEWLKKMEIAQSTANNFMRLYREYGDEQQSLFGSTAKSQTFGNLTYSKALKLLAIENEEERERFAAEKDVEHMSTRQLEQALRDREQALADKAVAEESRAKMAQDMSLLKAMLETTQGERVKAAEALNRAIDEADRAAQDVIAMEKQIAELKARPVEVAVQTVVDQEAVAKARAEGVAEMQKKLDKAKAEKDKLAAARDEAEERRKTAETELASMQAKLAAVQAEQRAEKPSALTSDALVAQFKIYFDQAQETANKMLGLLIKARSREDGAVAGSMEKALRALGEKIGGTAQ